jgi:hypothetical protein
MLGKFMLGDENGCLVDQSHTINDEAKEQKMDGRQAFRQRSYAIRHEK